MSDVLFFWTPVAILTAVLSGVSLGLVMIYLRHSHAARWLAVAGTFYYLPLMVQRVFDPTLVANGLRTVGTFGLFLLFCAALGLTSRIVRKA